MSRKDSLRYMQVKPHLNNQFVLLILGICFCTNISAAIANECKLTSRFKKAHTEKQCLRALIAAVDRQLIYKGMNVLDLDKILGSEFAKKIPPKESDETCSVYDFNERCKDWSLAVVYNGRGKILGFYLTNMIKGEEPVPAPAKVSIAQIAAKFRKAKTPTQKLECAILAMRARVIRQGTQRNTLSTIFGKSTEEKEVTMCDYPALVSSFAFGTDKNSWRLISNGDLNTDYIFDYELTNFDFDSWLKRYRIDNMD